MRNLNDLLAKSLWAEISEEEPLDRNIDRIRILMRVENNSFPEDIRIFHEATALTEAGYLVSVNGAVHS